MDVKSQLLQLVRLQQVVLDTRAALGVVEGAPARLEEIEERFRERNAEYVAVKDRHDALEADRRERSEELTELEAYRDKYTEDRKRVQNEREYAAILKEIDAVSERIAEHEDAILKDMEELEVAREELKTHEDHIQTERAQVEKESAEVAQDAERARETIERLRSERAATEGQLPRGLVNAVERLEAGRQGVFLAKADDGVCQSCYVRVRPQVFQEIRLATRIHSCGNCKRLLYHEPSIDGFAKKQDGEAKVNSSSGSGSVEALNGGSV